MERILFVDDNPELLEGLRHRLRPQRKRWEMVFVAGGEEALAEFARAPFDVVVSDMRMPRMDGGELLQRIRDGWPATGRVLLSGHTAEQALFMALSVAHQFLTKPCEAGVLENQIERLLALQRLVVDGPVRSAIGRTAHLPSLPAIYGAISTALADPKTSSHAVAALLRQDGALCAELLRTVNSAYFGLSRSIADVDEAVVFLGLETVRQLVLFNEVFAFATPQAPAPEYDATFLQHHALLTASMTARLCGPKVKEAYVAGLLHDLGKILIAAELPDRAASIAIAARDAGAPMVATEERLFATSHAEIGAYLLGLWQFPFLVVEAVAHHHHCERVQPHPGEPDLVAAVQLADALVGEVLAPPGRAPPTGTLPEAALARLGLAPGDLRLEGHREWLRARFEKLSGESWGAAPKSPRPG